MSLVFQRMFTRNRLSHGLLACAALMVFWLAPNPARADILVGVDVDGVEPFEDGAAFGGGFGVRLGTQLHIPLLAITPELAFTYAKFGDDYGPAIYRGMIGGRVAIGEIIRIGIYGHIGLGRFALDLDDEDPSGTDVTYDVGLALDFTVIPFLNLGVHAAYNSFGEDDDRPVFEWLTTGAHVEFVF
jgi:hypothetical protein